jgi:hypothetical protein
VITETSIVLVFVGILATFVVVSNYAQVQEIRKEYDKKIIELQSQIKITESKNEEIDIIKRDIFTVELTKLQDEYSSATTKEERWKIMNKLHVFRHVVSFDLKLEIFDVIENFIAIERASLDYNFTYNILELSYLFMPNISYRKNELCTIGKRILNISYDITYNVFVHSKKIAPAENSLLLVSWLNADIPDNIPEMKKEINNFFENIRRVLDRPSRDFLDAKKMIQAFQDNLTNKNRLLPIVDANLLDRIEKEKKEENMINSKMRYF